MEEASKIMSERNRCSTTKPPRQLQLYVDIHVHVHVHVCVCDVCVCDVVCPPAVCAGSGAAVW